MLLYYSKYPDQRIHVKTESGSADLAGGELYLKNFTQYFKKLCRNNSTVCSVDVSHTKSTAVCSEC